MSYCRWSCDDFQSDVYAYESECGYVVHVASRKYVGEIPHVDYDLLIDGKYDEWKEQKEKQDEFLDTAKVERIGLEYDGKGFTERTLADLLARLEELRDMGYRVPDHAFASVREEMEDGGGGQ